MTGAHLDAGTRVAEVLQVVVGELMAWLHSLLECTHLVADDVLIVGLLSQLEHRIRHGEGTRLMTCNPQMVKSRQPWA